MLWWPAGALALVAMIYLFLGANGFRKGANGRYAWTTHVLFAPYFIGAWINSRWWTRRHAGHNEIVPGLLLGRMPAHSDVRRDAIAAVVDVTAELGFNAPDVRHYRNEALLDLAPISAAQLARLANAIEQALAHGRTLVCCALGYSRSALAVAAWLLESGRASSADEAIAQVRKARPFVVLNATHQQALQEFARGLVSRGR
jgi:protein-tyrosine phosphatase